jgi:aspartyl-tRNA(Asn)/glutamyl-tRNA(Gln) amidotransferase subunit A
MATLTELRPNPRPNQAVTAGSPPPSCLPPAARLDGLFVAVKDLVAVAGRPLQAGTRARAEAPPEHRDAVVVAQLRTAGAIIGESVALHEIALGTTGINDQLGFSPNPRDPRRIPGGSSSGSAVAVAEGRCAIAIGTDTGGSIRIPAALCGVVGFKPSYDRYSRDGVLALAPTLDHVGWLAPTVEVVARVDHALTGESTTPVTSPGRLGVDRVGLELANPSVAAAIDRELARLHDAGWRLVDVRLPEPGRVHEATTPILFGEAATVHRVLLDRHADQLGADVLARLRHGAKVTDADYAAARAEALVLRAEVEAFLADVDAIVGPTVLITAPTIDEARRDDTLPAKLVSNTRLGNAVGLPTLSLPAPTDGLPVGLQLMARDDAATLALGAAIWQPENA